MPNSLPRVTRLNILNMKRALCVGEARVQTTFQRIGTWFHYRGPCKQILTVAGRPHEGVFVNVNQGNSKPSPNFTILYIWTDKSCIINIHKPSTYCWCSVAYSSVAASQKGVLACFTSAIGIHSILDGHCVSATFANATCVPWLECNTPSLFGPR